MISGLTLDSPDMSKVANSRFRLLKIYPIAIALGAAVGLVSIAFLFLVIVLKKLVWGPDHYRASALVVLGLCALGGLLVGLLNQAAERERGAAHDLNEALSDMHDVEVLQPPSAQIIFGRAALGVVSLGFGGPLGPEAPLVALVSQLSSRLSGAMRMARNRAVELSVAGSLGVLFGVPLVLSGIEEDSTSQGKNTLQKLSALGPEILAAVSSLAVITRFLPEVGMSFFHAEGSTDMGFGFGLIWIVVIALLASAVGRMLATSMPLVRQFFVEKLPGGPVPIGVVSGLILGAASLYSPLVLFSGHHEVQELLDHNVGGFKLVSLALLKLAVIVVCLAGGWYGGQIFPLGFIGATLGLALSDLTHSSSPLAFAAAGFIAASAAGLRKPLFALFLGVLLFPKETWIPMLLATAVVAATTETPAAPHSMGH